jgi:hypothetical protein
MRKKQTVKKTEAKPPWSEAPAPASKFPAVTQAASMAGKAIARLEDAARKVNASETERRGFQAVSSPSGFQLLVKHGRTVIEVQDDAFSIRQLDD